MSISMSIEEKSDHVLESAKKLAEQAKSWTDFSNQVFAQENGLVARAFPRMPERQAFYDTPQYRQTNDLLLELIKRFGISDGAVSNKSGKFIVRVPKTVHSMLEIEAKEEGVSLNQLALTKLSVKLRDSSNLAQSLVVEAFRQIYDGYSSDRIIVDPEYNEKYLEKCRKLGLGQSDYELNRILYDIRKGGKSILPPAVKKPRIDDYDSFVFASEIAFRQLQRTKGVTLDRVLCDPALRSQFDEIAGRLTAESSVFKLRMGAFYLRKTHRLSPSDMKGPSYDLAPAGKADRVKLSDVPDSPGMYAFYEHARPIYAGETAKLRNRIDQHIRTSGQLFLPRWLELGYEDGLELKWVAAPELNCKDRLRWLNRFINSEKPPLNYQIYAHAA